MKKQERVCGLMFVKQGGFLECEEISSDARDRLLSNIEVQFEDKCYSSKLFIDELKEVKDCLFLFFTYSRLQQLSGSCDVV